jgi:hypothetical protein
MDSRIINAFTDNDKKIVPMSGGQNTSVRVGGVVIKPIDEIEKYNWLAEKFEGLRSQNIIIANPVRDNTGNFLNNGYGATKYVRCKFIKNKLREKLLASDEFHGLVKGITKPEGFSLWESPWSKATKIAWSEIDLPIIGNGDIKRILESIQDKYEEVKLANQFIHSDLAGNILFRFYKPVIIDISPEFRPVEYANALLIADSIAWHGAKLNSLKYLRYDKELKRQLLIRAIMFRLCVPLCFSVDNFDGFYSEYKYFQELLNLI